MDENTSTTPELCTGLYSALQVLGAVYIFGNGLHFTSGYQVFFQQYGRLYPPEFKLFHIEPTGPVIPVIAAFSANTSFEATDPIDEVFVHDEHGRHPVSVQQLPSALEEHARTASDLDGREIPR